MKIIALPPSLLMASLLLSGAAFGADIAQVESQRIHVETDVKAMPVWRAAETAWRDAVELSLVPLAAERIEAVRAANAQPGIKATQIGIGRRVAQERASGDGTLRWQPIDGGRLAMLEVVSPGAEGLRVGLDLSALADDAEVRVAGSAYPDLLYGVSVADARQQLDADGLYWTAVTDGERQRLELFVAGDGPAVIPVIAVSHLLVGLHGDADISKAMKASGPCNVDVVCRVATLGQHYASTKDAVARMVFSSGGSSYTCTGTLLNDNDPGTTRLWFYSAHHCINTQAVANTLTTFWQNETPTCGSNQAGPNRQMTGGADLRHSSANTDALLLELRGSLPAGGTYTLAGWNTQPLSAAGTQVVAIHHPSGDRKKVSRGVFNRVSSYSSQVPSGLRVNWNEGTTEGGSSGSGLFTYDSNGFYLRGGLIGGAASCSNTNQSDASGNWDVYSRFDLVYPSIQQYLWVSSGPSRDYSGVWFVPSEAGWGLDLFQFPNVLFGLWFSYDNQGRPMWMQLDPAWTGVDVASGRVLRWTGPPWGATFDPNQRTATQVGTFTLTFTSATQATFSYSVDGVTRTVTLTKG